MTEEMFSDYQGLQIVTPSILIFLRKQLFSGQNVYLWSELRTEMKEMMDNKGKNALEKHTTWLISLPPFYFNINDEEGAGWGVWGLVVYLETHIYKLHSRLFE